MFSGYLNLPKILIDDRERQSGIFSKLCQQSFFDVEECRLESADIIIGSLGIERKTSEDYIRSIFEGRLFPQLFLIKRNFPKRLLLIEGNLFQNSEKIKKVARNTLLTISSELQIPIVYSKNLEDTVNMIIKIAIRQSRETSPAKLHFHKPKEQKDFTCIYVLSGLPGVGISRARILLKHFGTLKKVFQASPQELKEVSGIGEKLAFKINALLS